MCVTKLILSGCRSIFCVCLFTFLYQRHRRKRYSGFLFVVNLWLLLNNREIRNWCYCQHKHCHGNIYSCWLLLFARYKYSNISSSVQILLRSTCVCRGYRTNIWRSVCDDGAYKYQVPRYGQNGGSHQYKHMFVWIGGHGWTNYCRYDVVYILQ